MNYFFNMKYVCIHFCILHIEVHNTQEDHVFTQVFNEQMLNEYDLIISK